MTALLTNQEYKMCVPSEVVDDKLELFSSKIFLQIHNTKYILFFSPSQVLSGEYISYSASQLHFVPQRLH